MTNLFAAIAAYPKVQWQVIKNVYSGPSSTTYPHSDFITGISKLNSYHNVLTLDYVNTSYAKRGYSAVISHIKVYTNRAHYTKTKANISIAGIFSDATTFKPAAKPNYQRVSAYAYAEIHSDNTPVVFIPIELSRGELFQNCDTTVGIEIVTGNYFNDATIKELPRAQLDQSAIIA